MRNLAPVRSDYETRDDVGKERESQPLQDVGNLVISALDGGDSDGETKEDHEVVN